MAVKPALRERIKTRTGHLLVAHLALAGLMKDPAWKLEQSEAEALATSIVTVEDQYNLTIDPKTQAWVALIMTMATIYGPRLIVARQKAAERKAAARAAQQPFSQPNAQPVQPQPQQTPGGLVFG